MVPSYPPPARRWRNILRVTVTFRARYGLRYSEQSGTFSKTTCQPNNPWLKQRATETSERTSRYENVSNRDAQARGWAEGKAGSYQMIKGQRDKGRLMGKILKGKF